MRGVRAPTPTPGGRRNSRTFQIAVSLGGASVGAGGGGGGAAGASERAASSAMNEGIEKWTLEFVDAAARTRAFQLIVDAGRKSRERKSDMVRRKSLTRFGSSSNVAVSVGARENSGGNANQAAGVASSSAAASAAAASRPASVALGSSAVAASPAPNEKKGGDFVRELKARLESKQRVALA